MTRVWLNIESGIELGKYTIEAGLYLTQWKLSITKSKGGLLTLCIGPLWLSLWNNEQLREYWNAVIENNPYGDRDED